MGSGDGSAELDTPVLRPAVHQVAGHRSEGGRPVSSVDDSGLFYKPIHDDDRGNREVDFYNDLQANERVPPQIRAFFAKFYGTMFIEASNGLGKVNIHSQTYNFTLYRELKVLWAKDACYVGHENVSRFTSAVTSDIVLAETEKERVMGILRSGSLSPNWSSLKILYTVRFLNKNLQRHAIMEDLAHGIRHPSIVDLKIGARTWYPGASDQKIKKYKKKDMETTSGALGFRVSGIQVYEASSGTTFKASRDWIRNLTVDDVTLALKRYVSSNPWNETNPDGAFAVSVYGGAQGIIAQLEILKDWFCTQTDYHFASSSVLLIYGEDHGSTAVDGLGHPHRLRSPNSAIVKLVDFAHTISGKGSLDENFLEGLKTLIGFLVTIVDSQTAS